jgi:hypothetical protein
VPFGAGPLFHLIARKPSFPFRPIPVIEGERWNGSSWRDWDLPYCPLSGHYGMASGPCGRHARQARVMSTRASLTRARFQCRRTPPKCGKNSSTMRRRSGMTKMHEEILPGNWPSSSGVHARRVVAAGAMNYRRQELYNGEFLQFGDERADHHDVYWLESQEKLVLRYPTGMSMRAPKVLVANGPGVATPVAMAGRDVSRWSFTDLAVGSSIVAIDGNSKILTQIPVRSFADAKSFKPISKRLNGRGMKIGLDSHIDYVCYASDALYEGIFFCTPQNLARTSARKWCRRHEG